METIKIIKNIKESRLIYGIKIIEVVIIFNNNEII